MDIHDINPGTTARHDNVDIGQRVPGRVKAKELIYSNGLASVDVGNAIVSRPYKKVWNTYSPGSAFGTTTAGLVGSTAATLIALDSDFDAVRIPLFNFDTASSQTYDAVAVAVTGNAADPVNGTGAYTVAKFSGTTAVTLPAATVVSGRIQPSMVLSDPIYIASVPRSDGGSRPLLCVRIYMSTGAGKLMSFWTFGAGGGAGDWMGADGRLWLGYKLVGDFASTAQSSMTSANSTPERGYSPLMGVVFRARAAANASILCIGDSITRGSNAELFGRGWTYKLMDSLSTPGRPVTTANFGISGSKADEFLSVATKVLATFPATHAIYPAWAVNDTSAQTVTAANIATMRADLVQFLELCNTYGVIPILWKGTPRSTDATTNPPVGYYTSTDSLRLDWVNSVASQYGAVVIDTLSDLTTTTVPAAFKFGLSVEGLHPNSTGDTIISVSMAKDISTYLAIT